MHKKLLNDAFEKAAIEINTFHVSPRSQHLSDFIINDTKEPYGERILREKFKALQSGTSTNIRLKKHAEEALSHYLDYKDYNEFVAKNKDYKIKEDKSLKLFLRKNRITIMVSILLIIGLLVYNSATTQRWMIWNENHYIEVNFDTEKYDLHQLKVYKEERINNFKKINPTCSYSFFNEDGSVRIWYGKNNNKKIEYFTALGLHPETGKTLKQITKYIIDKYICH
ncbi:hypothetical protein HNV10_12560 [Winogradskyella litoriviva]|uniref:Anti-sigma factor n=1 Tax=Winogradskyella litoriviva TaxID=1220182 RepID=A0ABX2E6W0_9FLAO|nr:hypothetical protein [Winogradskyella litoriviva]NRD24084.1 hypothetical protein [Winogradskyella litoriviva]